MRIKTIIILLMLMLTFVFFAGCVDNDETVVETIPLDVDETPTEIIEETPVEEPDVVEETPVVDPQTHVIRMENYMVKIISPFEINRGDSILWRNNQDPKRQLQLTSEDGLWENVNLNYRQTFTYTFNKSGTYNFSVIGLPKMSGSIIVN